jgi:hypothetical protein
MKKIWNWLLSSNRYKHLGLGFIYGLGANGWYCAAYGGIGVSGALEFKDWQWGGKPDWIDATPKLRDNPRNKIILLLI